MSKLKLVDIHKSYKAGNTTVKAMNGISLEFRESEFVAILGPSGCGKTTTLNVVGGLDRYDDGDLIINGLSTKKFKNSDWDAYRNRSIGFVFQNYNLIGHLNLIQNVEISMTLSGVSASERKARAKKALIDVGLEDHMTKRPNQLSGGQMQRVAIARALVNNPDIILADEPTGALDSVTSVQVMEILKEIAKTRLVIMVTHNAEMAEEYSNRVIRLKDGEVMSDSHPIEAGELPNQTVETESKKLKKTSMSYFTAISLSFRNLMTKKGRTIVTSFAGSIGIVGVALVLALSAGLSGYINDAQSTALAGLPITISTQTQASAFDEPASQKNAKSDSLTEYPTNDVVYPYDSAAATKMHTNVLTPDYITYMQNLNTAIPGTTNDIQYTSGLNMNVLSKGDNGVVQYSTTDTPDQAQQVMGVTSLYWQELPDNSNFLLSTYDLLGANSRLPSAKNEVAVVVDKYNRVDTAFLDKLGITSPADKMNFEDFIGNDMLKVIPNNDYYTESNGVYAPATPANFSNVYTTENGIQLTVTGVLRIKDGVANGLLSEGIVYTQALADYMKDDSQKSNLAVAQNASDNNIFTGTPFKNSDARKLQLQAVGADTTPTTINIYPKDFASKTSIKKYLDDYNVGKSDDDKVIYTDFAESVTKTIGTAISVVTVVLVGFAAISLIVSTVMIGIITYVSVVERTKEIGILRSVGARKKDISRVFNAETLIVGFIAGAFGVGLSFLLTIPISSVVFNATTIPNIAQLHIIPAIVLIVGSMTLTLIAGLIPSSVAAKKDPVVALRSE